MMKCKRAKESIALSVGRDLDPATEQELRRHLTTCPRCHDQWDRLRSSTAILQRVAAEEAEVPEPRLWSHVSRNIRGLSRRNQSRPKSFSLSDAAVPLVAVASLLLAVVSIAQSLNNPPVTAGGSVQPDPDGLHPANWKPILPVTERSVEPPPEPPLQRMLQDQRRYQEPPAQNRRDYTLPGGFYELDED